MARGSARLIRQWALVAALAPHRRGVRIAQLCERLDTSRATVYRDLQTLREAGVAVETHTDNGEARVTLFGASLPPLAPSPLQLAALQLARRALGTLDGTSAVAELDKILGGYVFAASGRSRVTLAKPNLGAPDIVQKLDRAIGYGRRVRIRHRGARDAAPAWRLVDPLGLHFSKGHLYFVAHDQQRAALRTFKTDRILGVDILSDKAARHPEFDPQTLFGPSAKIWTGSVHDVVVRLSPAVARFAHEYPLHAAQSFTDNSDGSVLVRARVAGIPEAMRWVLGWGKDAEALEPDELREAVQREVTAAAEQYARPESLAARRGRANSGMALKQVVSRDRETGAS